MFFFFPLTLLSPGRDNLLTDNPIFDVMRYAVKEVEELRKHKIILISPTSFFSSRNN